MMAARWMQLKLRERLFVIAGVVFVIVLAVEFLVWSPLVKTRDRLQSQVHTQQQTLLWMHHAGRRIRTLKAAGFREVHPTQENLLVTAERSLQQQKLSRYLSGVQQPQPNRLQLTFKKIPFDTIMTWLQMLWTDHAINVQAITVKRMAPGQVSAAITLKNSAY